MDKDEYFKNICKETSKLSTCISKQVGAVLTRQNRILAIGYNGTTPGSEHCNTLFKKDFKRKDHHHWSTNNELHAEQNIISFCSKNGIKTDNTTLYVSLSPCIHCAKLIVASGIHKVVYYDEYDLDKLGLSFLLHNGIQIFKY